MKHKQLVPTVNSIPPAVSVLIRPNRSLPPGGMLALFVTLASVALTISIGFTLAGAWMILPFTGLEIAAIAALCYWLYRHIDDCELIVIERDRVRVIKRSGTREASHDFPRYWARVQLDSSRDKRYPSRLALGSHGRFVEIATDVTEDHRHLLARKLKNALRRETQEPARLTD